MSEEQFLVRESLSLLQLGDVTEVFSVPAKVSERGRPSSGVVILVNKRLEPTLYAEESFFVSAQVKTTVVYSV